MGSSENVLSVSGVIANAEYYFCASLILDVLNALDRDTASLEWLFMQSHLNLGSKSDSLHTDCTLCHFINK